MGLPAPLLLVGTGVLCLGNLLHIVGLGTTHWVEVDVMGIKGHTGLFKACSDILDSCSDVRDTTELEAVQAMAILGMLAGLASAGIACLYLLFKVLSKSLPKILVLLCPVAGIAAFVCIVIAVCVFAGEIYNSDVHEYGYSFALSIVGGLLIAGGALIVYVGARSGD